MTSMNKAQKLIKLIDEGHYSDLDRLYSLRASFKIDGKRPPKGHKNYPKYLHLTKKIRKVRNRFTK